MGDDKKNRLKPSRTANTLTLKEILMKLEMMHVYRNYEAQNAFIVASKSILISVVILSREYSKHMVRGCFRPNEGLKHSLKLY